MSNFSKQFKEERVLGSGGFGIARLVKRKSDGQRFVIKELKDPIYNEAQKSAAKREVESMKRLQGLSKHILE